MGALVDAVGLPIDFLDAIDVFVDPGGVLGVSIDFLDAMGVFLDLGGVTDATPDLVEILMDHGSISGVLVDAVGLSINFEDAIGVFWTQGASGALPWAW